MTTSRKRQMVHIGSVNVSCPNCECPMNVDLTGVPARAVAGEVTIHVKVDDRKLSKLFAAHIAEHH